MPTFERRDDTGEVLERVRTVEGSLEDTRLGVAALEGRGGWVLVGETSPAAPAPVGEQEQPHGPATDAEVPAPDTTSTAVKRRKGKPKED